MIEEFHDTFIDDVPFREMIHLERTPDGLATNVPHLVVSGSPTGFEWGYGGSGPSDLALNILEHYLQIVGYQGGREKCFRGTCFRLAWILHQDFKWQMIAPLDREAHTHLLMFETLDAWMKERMKPELLEQCKVQAWEEEDDEAGI